MIRRRYKGNVVFQLSSMTTNRNDVMKKGRALIASLSEKEKQAIYSQLDVYQKQLFTSMQNHAWSNL